MKLSEEIRQVLSGYALPAHVTTAMTEAMARLDENKVAPGIGVGERAPDFRLPTLSGETKALGDFLSKGPLVLTFYRGEWCPICNLQLTALQRALPEIKEAGASLAAISPQAMAHGASLAEKHHLGFELLADLKQETIRNYRLQFTMPQEVQKIYTGSYGLDISRENADGSWKLPVPGTFIIDPGGIVRARHVTADFTRRMEPDEVVEVLESLHSPVER